MAYSHKAKFILALSGPAAAGAQVHYRTVNDTLIGGADFETTDNIYEFAEGDTQGVVYVPCRDPETGAAGQFTMEIDEAVNCTLRDVVGLALFPGAPVVAQGLLVEDPAGKVGALFLRAPDEGVGVWNDLASDKTYPMNPGNGTLVFSDAENGLYNRPYFEFNGAIDVDRLLVASLEIKSQQGVQQPGGSEFMVRLVAGGIGNLSNQAVVLGARINWNSSQVLLDIGDSPQSWNASDLSDADFLFEFVIDQQNGRMAFFINGQNRGQMTYFNENVGDWVPNGTFAFILQNVGVTNLKLGRIEVKQEDGILPPAV